MAKTISNTPTIHYFFKYVLIRLLKLVTPK